MCKEIAYAKMEKLGLKYVDVQDRALKLQWVTMREVPHRLVSPSEETPKKKKKKKKIR